MTCPVCKQAIDSDDEATWLSEDDDNLHLECADSLILAVLKLRKRNDYGRTVFEIIADSAVKIANG